MPEKQYQVITAETISKLEQRVNHAMEMDWMPIGGIIVDGNVMAQAMIKTPIKA